jgi:uncharacterized membrane protein YebE (DUF533 family)
MGFLDSMVSGMIRESTGYDTRQIRRWVRRIGGSKLLLAGGAAVAGALAAQQFGKAGTSGGRATPPPPPPSGGPVPPDLPPLPPLPTTGSAAEGETEEIESAPELPRELLFAVVRTMAAAALADGEMAPEERAALEEHLDDSGLTPEQIGRVRKDLVLPPTPGELAEMVEELPEQQAAGARETLFRAAALIVHADRQVTGVETAWLGKLAAELNLSPEQADSLRDEVFADAADDARDGD